MAWLDFLTGLGSGMTATGKVLSWQQEMDADEQRRRDLLNRQGVEDMLRQAEHQQRMDAAKRAGESQEFNQVKDILSVQSLDEPLRGDFAARATNAGFGGMLEEKPGQLEAMNIPSWTGIDYESPEIEGGTYRRPTALEKKAQSEMAAAAEKQRRIDQKRAAASPEMQQMYDVMEVTEGLGGNVSLGNQYLEDPTTRVGREISEEGRKQRNELDLISARGANEKSVIKYRDQVTRAFDKWKAEQPLTPEERERLELVPRLNAQLREAEKYEPLTLAQQQTLEITQRIMTDENIRQHLANRKADIANQLPGSGMGGGGDNIWLPGQVGAGGGAGPATGKPPIYPTPSGGPIPPRPPPVMSGRQRQGAGFPPSVTQSPADVLGALTGGGGGAPAPGAPAPAPTPPVAPPAPAPAPPAPAGAPTTGPGNRKPAQVGDVRMQRDPKTGQRIRATWNGNRWVPTP